MDAANSILLVSHKKPDADTLGAASAWLCLLTTRGKRVRAFCLDPVPRTLTHLPETHRVENDTTLFEQPFDLIIVNDAGSPDYTGLDAFLAARQDNGKTIVINIDHHATNTHYGDINLVLPDASSTTEILTRLFMHWGEHIDHNIAQALLAGLITDTDRMTNPATSYRSLEIASMLINAGANLYDAIQRTLNQKSIADLKLWGIALSRLKRLPQHGAIATYFTHKDIEDAGASNDSAEGIINYLSLIPDARIIMMLQAFPDGHLKGSFRTTRPNIDVGRLAVLLGGGGHKKASGFRIRGELAIEGDRWTVK